MPKIEISHKDLCSLIGRKFSTEQLFDEILYAKGELDDVSGDTLKIDIKDTNRPDLWSAEGIAREIRGRYKRGMPNYAVKKSNFNVTVDKSVENVRPYTVCAVVKGLRINGTVMSQMLQLQEKVAGTFGRNRKEIAIGMYDLGRIKFPVTYKTTKPGETGFVPLGMGEKMLPKHILERHQKGKEYGHLLAGKSLYPIFVDASGEVLSMPPIINSGYSGKVTEKTSDIFVECSGFSLKFLNTAINVIVAALHERGGTIYSVNVKYGNRTIVTPDLSPKKFYANIGYINKVAGINFSDSQIKTLLEKALYKVGVKGKRVGLLYPAYRQDIMHERDIVEDVLISYGFNEAEPEELNIITKGSMSKEQIISGKITEAMVGCGLQEILSYTLTDTKCLYDKMLTNGRPIKIEKPVSSNRSAFRTWLLPGLLEFFSKNKHVEYPQSIFEIGTAVIEDASTPTRSVDMVKLSAAITSDDVNYETVASRLDAMFRSIGIAYTLRKGPHQSLIDGRSAEIVVGKKRIGLIGEINPEVLNNWTLEKPVVAFEIGLDEIFDILGRKL